MIDKAVLKVPPNIHLLACKVVSPCITRLFIGKILFLKTSYPVDPEVNLVDVMGSLFTAPVLVPYGQQLGATTGEIASFSMVPGPKIRRSVERG